MDDNTSLSKFMALILRHRPEAAGIELDAHGWASVDDLIEGINKSGSFKIDRQILEEIVATDEKKRYAFSEDKTKIRAQQGHTVRVDVEPEEKEPPETLYHGTVERFLGPILKEGLRHKERLYVHLSKDIDTARAVGQRRGEPVVLCVAAGKMARDGYKFYLSANGVWLTDHVPPEYLKVLDR